MTRTASLCRFLLATSLLLLPLITGCGDRHTAPQMASVLPATRPMARVAASMPVTRPATTTASDAFPDSADPRATIPFLASDALAGRLPGTPGLERAGDFLALELSRIGLKPLPGQTDYFQNFTMSESATLVSPTRLTLNGIDQLLHKDYEPMFMTAEKPFAGKVVFAGFGITRPADDASHYDDYAGIDARGKVVLAMMKEPLDEKNVSRFAHGRGPWSNSALFTTKAKNAADHGAVALLLVAPPASGGGDVLTPFVRDDGNRAGIPVIQITRHLTNVMLSMGKTFDLKKIQDTINTGFKPDSMDLPDLDVSGDVAIKRTSVDVRNVMAYLPGTGPHADEWIVIGAHYDHLGRGQMGHMVGGHVGSIWHGADDNASGTGAVLELAERMKKAGPLPRSVLFIFFTAEEEGLIGSNHFVNNPLIPLDKIVAMLNLDMVGRLRGNALQIGGAGTAPIWDTIVKDTTAGTGITTSTALPEDGGRGGMGPSDHMSFAEKKIPVLFLFTGMHIDYHRPTDTADKINYDGIEKLVDLSQKIAVAMANMPWQKYDPRNDNGAMSQMLPGGGGGKHHAILGIRPDESAAEAQNGIPISEVTPGGPAEKAGLRAGDLIVAFNAKPMKNLSDISEALDSAHVGDKVVVKVMRDGKAVELNAVLGEP